MDHRAEIELLQRYYEALNRKDFDALSETFDPQIEWLEPSEEPEGGRWSGRDAVINHFEEGLGKWSEGTCVSERFVVAGDRIVSLEKVNVRLKGQEDWIKGQLAAVFVVRDGRIAQGRIFWERSDAFRWVGIEPPNE
jgi:ketosteroid isomerase-like protein